MALPLSEQELLLIADINNPGFRMYAELYPEDHAAYARASLRENVKDAVENLYPGQFGEKWGVDEKKTVETLRAAADADLEELCAAVTAFWESATDDRITAFYPRPRKEVA